MQGVGQFSKKIQYVGGLWGADIHNGAPIRILDPVTHRENAPLTYLGNRVNLYVYDGISTASRTGTAGLSIGFAVFWRFGFAVAGVEPGGVGAFEIREVDWNGETDATAQIIDPVKQLWMEQKIEYAASAAGSGFQLGEVDVNVYSLPIDLTSFVLTGYTTLQRYRVIPMTARGDAMSVFFWSNPANWVGSAANNDSIQLWIDSGSDVAGSQRIGGGHG